VKKPTIALVLFVCITFLLASCSSSESQVEIIDVGSTIDFGGYDWRVLYVQGDRALIITENVVRTRAFHDTAEDVTWATSDIRHYLNGEFFDNFSVADSARISETTLVNNDNQWFLVPGGADTTDKIFLLSIEEVVQHFGDSGMFESGIDPNERTQGFIFDPDIFGIYGWGIHDQYSNARIAANEAGEVLWWWLRSPGMSTHNVAGVFYEGYLLLNNILATSITGGVRPALWLYL